MINLDNPAEVSAYLKKRQRFPLGRWPRAVHVPVPPRRASRDLATGHRSQSRRPNLDAAARARKFTVAGTISATVNFAAGTAVAAGGNPVGAVIAYTIAVTCGVLAFVAAWPALRRRHVWLKHPSLAWCLLGGKYYRVQLRIALAARRDADLALRTHELLAAPAGKLTVGVYEDGSPATVRWPLQPACCDCCGLPADEHIGAPVIVITPDAPGPVPARRYSLREYRCQLRFTAAQLDTAAGLPADTVLAIETGRRRVTVRTAQALAVALRAAAGDLGNAPEPYSMRVSRLDKRTCWVSDMPEGSLLRVSGEWWHEVPPGKLDSMTGLYEVTSQHGYCRVRRLEQPDSPGQCVAHYYATAGWLHYTDGETALWFGPEDPQCRCDACRKV